ncbi:MAG: hypothetical protein QNJ56_02545 [Gammaproteobacteria bacterium]|nr:hypothetical protein [Gammaproteobacteria bacterium]
MEKSSEHYISDELLNSYIDRQITSAERQEILDLIKQDKHLAGRVCALQNLKEMTRLSYDDIPASRLPETVIEKSPVLPRLAAVLAIFSLGLLMGLGSMHISQHNHNASNLVQQDTLTKVLVHLTSSDTDDGLNTLSNLEQMLEAYESKQEPVHIEVIANGNGIRLLSPQEYRIAERIHYLTQKYDNLNFAACKNTLDQLRMTRGIDLKLIPEVKLIDSGVVEVIKRQREGWTYIRG